MDAYELLKKATKQRDAGKIDEAINTLHKAYSNLNPRETPMEVYLRLPMYLLDAGRPDEAWGEFNRLIHETSQRYSSLPATMYRNLCPIYKKMRIFLTKQKKHNHAVKFGAWTLIAWGAGLYEDNGTFECGAEITDDEIRKELSKLLKM